MKVATSTVPVQPGALLHTSGSVKYHSIRVYHQIQEWLGGQMVYVDWCRRVSAGNLLSIMTDLQPVFDGYSDNPSTNDLLHLQIVSYEDSITILVVRTFNY